MPFSPETSDNMESPGCRGVKHSASPLFQTFAECPEEVATELTGMSLHMYMYNIVVILFAFSFITSILVIMDVIEYNTILLRLTHSILAQRMYNLNALSF